MAPFSILLSLYAKENPDYFRQALERVFNQTCPSPDVVLVLDGPITYELQAVVDDFKSQYPKILKVIPLEKNVGLGRALNEGLKHCSYEIVARMDTDDISKPDRFARQLDVLNCNPNIDVVGSWIDEFTGLVDNIVATRQTPESHDAIEVYAKKRNPMNHGSVVFRKSAVGRAGEYQHFPLFEDYYLWVRMLVCGCRFVNIPESLVLVRVSPEMYRRRGGSGYIKTELAFQRELYRLGIISPPRMVLNIAVRSAFRLMPSGLMGVMYKFFLRKHD